MPKPSTQYRINVTRPRDRRGALGNTAPRVGGIIEDETGWWQITQVEDGYAWLLGRDGTERQVKFGNLGHVTYEEDDSGT